MSDNFDLDEWQERVENFGGRIGGPGAQKLWKELEASNLGSSTTLDTTAVAPVLPPTVTLAEMKLSKPIRVDVSFSYFNELWRKKSVVPVVSPAASDGQASPGDGFVRITWGVPGAPQMEVDCDGGLGWRYPFVASYLRVEYIPVDDLSTVETHIAGSQNANLGLKATIAPASGAPCLPLVKSMYYPEILAGQVRWANIPRRAVNFRFAAWVQAAATGNYDIRVFPSIAAITTDVVSDLTAGSWPAWVSKAHKFPIPQNGRFISVGSPALSSTLSNPVIVCELNV